jgi:hypothetical protein
LYLVKQVEQDGEEDLEQDLLHNEPVDHPMVVKDVLQDIHVQEMEYQQRL